MDVVDGLVAGLVWSSALTVINIDAGLVAGLVKSSALAVLKSGLPLNLIVAGSVFAVWTQRGKKCWPECRAYELPVDRVWNVTLSIKSKCSCFVDAKPYKLDVIFSPPSFIFRCPFCRGSFAVTLMLAFTLCVWLMIPTVSFRHDILRLVFAFTLCLWLMTLLSPPRFNTIFCDPHPLLRCVSDWWLHRLVSARYSATLALAFAPIWTSDEENDVAGQFNDLSRSIDKGFKLIVRLHVAGCKLPANWLRIEEVLKEWPKSLKELTAKVLKNWIDGCRPESLDDETRACRTEWMIANQSGLITVELYTGSESMRKMRE